MEKTTTMLRFDSGLKNLGKIPQTFSENDIKNETMLFSADYEFARRNGDGLTNLFLDHLPQDWKDSKLIIDSRVHMLMKGWAPCIPGWHHDDVPRTGDGSQFVSKGQPNYLDPEYYAEHILFLINSDVAPTEFYNHPIELALPKHGEVIYREWNKIVSAEVDARKLQGDISPVVVAEDSTMYRFDWQTFHRGVEAQKNGWRFFIRASRYFNDINLLSHNHSRFQRRTMKNEIRRQTQVYIRDFEKGW